MLLTTERVEEILISEIKSLYNVKISDMNENLLSQRIGIPVANFLYLFAELENKYGMDIYSIMAKNDCEVFTVKRLSAEIQGQQIK